ncbi:hypothetical protein, partial [Klebsiella pneumoniae]|uniref:hypothetical protein n=1 Tax=Klebsiella pneumoniae TaxID=573 RepID=UPI0027318D69
SSSLSVSFWLPGRRLAKEAMPFILSCSVDFWTIYINSTFSMLFFLLDRSSFRARMIRASQFDDSITVGGKNTCGK